MENSTRIRTAALGVLLATFGFMCGYLTGERPTAPTPNRYAAAAPPPPPQCGINRRVVAMDWRSNQPYATTIIVMQDGRPIQIEQRGTFAVADNNIPSQAPPPAGGAPTPRHGLLLGVMLLALMPMVTWAALAWNRRKGQGYPYSESEPYQEFVPRRDD